MFQRSILTALVILGSSSAAFSADKLSSEFFYQADASQTAFTPHFGYNGLTTKAKTVGAVDNKTDGIADTGASIEYGLNDMFALKADFAFKSQDVDTGSGATTKPKISGFQDPTVSLKGVSDMGFGHLHYGAALTLGFAKQKTETNNDVNASSGGMALNPYVGADMSAGPGVVGASLAYMFNMERTADYKGTEYKGTGGNALQIAAFYEYMLSDMVLGADLKMTSIDESTVKQNDVEVAKNKAFSPLGMDLYATIPVESLTLIPSLAYDFSAGGDAYEKYNDMTLGVAARWLF